MKSSYKLSLLVAAVLCIVVVTYYSTQRGPDESIASIQKQAEPVVHPPPQWRPDGAGDTPVAASSPAATVPAPAPTVTPAAFRPPPAAPPTASPSAPPQTAASKSTQYVVKAGDTLVSIARKLYGDERKWVQIAQANPRVDPQKLKVGQVLRLPDLAVVNRASTSTAPVAAAPTTTSTKPTVATPVTTTTKPTATVAATTNTKPVTAAPTATASHIVGPGDTLSTIAMHYYGSGTQWRYLYNANKAAIGDNPNRLKAGSTLTIPPMPKVQ